MAKNGQRVKETGIIMTGAEATSFSYSAMRNEGVAFELSNKTSREEAAFKASLAPLAR